jgi:hypothetical protein
MNITIEQKITELKRLNTYYKDLYRQWTEKGLCDNYLANFRLSLLQSMLKDYERQARINQQQLFERKLQNG